MQQGKLGKKLEWPCRSKEERVKVMQVAISLLHWSRDREPRLSHDPMIAVGSLMHHSRPQPACSLALDSGDDTKHTGSSMGGRPGQACVVSSEHDPWGTECNWLESSRWWNADWESDYVHVERRNSCDI